MSSQGSKFSVVAGREAKEKGSRFPLGTTAQREAGQEDGTQGAGSLDIYFFGKKLSVRRRGWDTILTLKKFAIQQRERTSCQKITHQPVLSLLAVLDTLLHYIIANQRIYYPS